MVDTLTFCGMLGNKLISIFIFHLFEAIYGRVHLSHLCWNLHLHASLFCILSDCSRGCKHEQNHHNLFDWCRQTLVTIGTLFPGLLFLSRSLSCHDDVDRNRHFQCCHITDFHLYVINKWKALFSLNRTYLALTFVIPATSTWLEVPEIPLVSAPTNMPTSRWRDMGHWQRLDRIEAFLPSKILIDAESICTNCENKICFEQYLCIIA